MSNCYDVALLGRWEDFLNGFQETLILMQMSDGALRGVISGSAPSNRCRGFYFLREG